MSRPRKNEPTPPPADPEDLPAFADQDDDDELPPQPAPVPVPPPRPRKPAAEKPPAYLAELAALEGVGADVFTDTDNLGTAWVKIESTETGTVELLPLAHLAPNALGTLADMNFEGHTKFELRDGRDGKVLRYFAAELDDLPPPPEPDPNAPPAPAGADAGLVQLLTNMQQQINRLSAREHVAPVQAVAVDPLAALDKGLLIFERIGGVIAKIQAAAPQAVQQQGSPIIDALFRTLPDLLKGSPAPALPPEGSPDAA